MQPTATPPTALAATAPVPADLGTRVVAALIDGLCPVVLFWLPVINLLVWIGWMLCRDLVFGGQSVGKKIMGLKVVDAATGVTPPAQQLILRNAIHAIPCVGPVVELIVLATNKDKLKLGDQIAKAMVVKA